MVFIFSLIKALIFFLTIKLVASNTTLMIVLASIAGAFGSSYPVYKESRNKKNQCEEWQYTIAATNRKSSKRMADKLKRAGLSVSTSEGYTYDKSSILMIHVDSVTKDDSRLIWNIIEKDSKVKIVKDIESFVKR